MGRHPHKLDHIIVKKKAHATQPTPKRELLPIYLRHASKYELRMYRNSQNRRKKEAALPFDQKLRILFDLQRLSSVVRHPKRRINNKPWDNQ